jgi:acyl-CoA synthetase (AMP-forming)/AMP-acid ligase II
MIMWKTLTEMMAYHAQTYPDSLYVRFLERGEVTGTYTYAQMWAWASRWAALLSDRGVRYGHAVLIALPNSEDFVGAYFGTLLAGGVPAPVAPLRRLEAGNAALEVLAQRLNFVSGRVLVVPESQATVGELEPLSQIEGLHVLTGRDLPPTAEAASPGGSADDTALLQFTSGTSGKPKAVQLSQFALLAQARAISDALKLVRGVDWAVSWLPLFHDMGLIGYLLTPAYVAGDVSLIKVEDFITRPNLWVKALSDWKASITGGPPSAYAACARRASEADVAQYDLSRLRIALVGAEMVRSSSLELFADKFERAGLRKSSLMPTYGLAENGLAVTMTPLDRGPRFDTIDLKVMQECGIAQPAQPAQPSEVDGASVREFASVGVPIMNTQVNIAGPEGEWLGERRIGEIAVCSPSLMTGYYEEPEQTAAILRDGWLYTGDMGYIVDGELYITGRKKEVLIVGGRNYYPDDLEAAVDGLEGIRSGRVVATSYEDPDVATEVVVVMAETALENPGERSNLRLRIRNALVEAGYPIGKVVLLPPRTIQTTPNGKLKRVECKVRYLAGEFNYDS